MVLKACAGLYLLVIIIEWWQSRNFLRFSLELLPLLGLIVIDLFLASATAGYITFGADNSSLYVVLLMFIAILLGVSARYVFYLKGKFAWLDFCKPLCLSPLLLLPLIGSLQSIKSFEPIQIVSFVLLAFQNGFFGKLHCSELAKKMASG